MVSAKGKKRPSAQKSGTEYQVYTRELPPGRALAGAAPGAYGYCGEFIPWEKLSTHTDPDGCVFRAVSRPADMFFLVLPESIREIGSVAFRNSRRHAVILPDGLVSAGRYSFDSCAAGYIRFPPGLRNIDVGAFRMSGMRTAVLPESVRSIGSSAFLQCGAVSVTAVSAAAGSSAFARSRRLVSARVRQNVRYGVFSDCSALRCLHTGNVCSDPVQAAAGG